MRFNLAHAYIPDLMTPRAHRDQPPRKAFFWRVDGSFKSFSDSFSELPGIHLEVGTSWITWTVRIAMLKKFNTLSSYKTKQKKEVPSYLDSLPRLWHSQCSECADDTVYADRANACRGR